MSGREHRHTVLESYTNSTVELEAHTNVALRVQFQMVPVKKQRGDALKGRAAKGLSRELGF